MPSPLKKLLHAVGFLLLLCHTLLGALIFVAATFGVILFNGWTLFFITILLLIGTGASWRIGYRRPRAYGAVLLAWLGALGLAEYDNWLDEQIITQACQQFAPPCATPQQRCAYIQKNCVSKHDDGLYECDITQPSGRYATYLTTCP